MTALVDRVEAVLAPYASSRARFLAEKGRAGRNARRRLARKTRSCPMTDPLLDEIELGDRVADALAEQQKEDVE